MKKDTTRKANYFYKLRVRYNLTQLEMANTLGIAQGTYCKYELGQLSPSAFTLGRLRKAFKLDVNYLLDNKII